MLSKENRDVSVVIPTRNSAATIEKCLESVIRERPGEIIAVDMMSVDETLGILERYGARILINGSLSLGYSRQLGVVAAKGRFVMFVDSDMELGIGCIAKLRSDLEKYHWAGIRPTAFSSENATYWQRAAGEDYSLFRNRVGPSHEIGTGGALFRREILIQHPFDVNFEESFEDVDLCRRLVKANYPLGVSRAIAYHLSPREFTAFAKQQFRYGRGNARVAFKYRSTWMLIKHLEAAVYFLIYGALTGRARLIPFWVAANILKFLGTVAGASRPRARRDQPNHVRFGGCLPPLRNKQQRILHKLTKSCRLVLPVPKHCWSPRGAPNPRGPRHPFAIEVVA